MNCQRGKTGEMLVEMPYASEDKSMIDIDGLLGMPCKYVGYWPKVADVIMWRKLTDKLP